MQQQALPDRSAKTYQTRIGTFKSFREFGYAPSADDLLRKLGQYIEAGSGRVAIAKEGRRLATEKHRSWQRMEKMIFGRILTTPDLEDLVEIAKERWLSVSETCVQRKRRREQVQR